MKKMFFTALVAIVAIGGATAQVYAPGGTEPLPCIEGGFSCGIYYGDTGHTDAYPFQGTFNEVSLYDYTRVF